MIIALNGYAGSGKDTVAEHLVSKYGFKRFAFADKVRELAEALDPALYRSSPSDYPQRLHSVLDWSGGWDRAKRIPEVREYLQMLGTTIRNILGDDAWLNQFTPTGHVDWVITDMRYRNEMYYLDAVDETWFVQIVREGVGPVNGHRSETELENAAYDFIIRNEGTIEELHKDVDFIMEYMGCV